MPQDLLQVVSPDGTVNANLEPGLDAEELKKWYRFMLLVRTVDSRCMNLQRQGRIGFYVPSTGQEACQIGSAAALEEGDWVFPTYREPGLLLWRGFPLKDFIAQLFGNSLDRVKGRQMPNHFTSREHRWVSISSPIATQIPQGVGAAMAMKLKGDSNVALISMGDGGTSEGDFHVGMNFAGVYDAPAVFFCQNNQYAISVPVEEQTASETIAQKAVAYGFKGVRVDGNDVLAVYRALREAAERARSGGGPTLVEALTFRMGPHSTSDDPTRYRPDERVAPWQDRDPIVRFQQYLLSRGLLQDGETEALEEELQNLVNQTVKEVEAAAPPRPQTIFEDVYAEMPWHLAEQQQELLSELEEGE